MIDRYEQLLRFFYQPYKWLVYIPLMLINTLVMGVFCLLICLVNGSLAGKFAARPWARFNMLITPASVKITGANNLKPGQSYVVVVNHSSLFDILVLYGWLDLDLKWVMKKELLKVPIIGIGCAAMGHIFIDRSNKQAAVQALRDAKKTLTKGKSVLFFPEGSRSRDDEMLPFKAGAFMMAKDIGLPILPVTVKGTNKILPSDTLDLHPGYAEMIIHPAIASEHIQSTELEELIQQTRSTIQKGLDQSSETLLAEYDC